MGAGTSLVTWCNGFRCADRKNVCIKNDQSANLYLSQILDTDLKG